jgi:DNA-binding NtrC family response regulator
MQKSRVLVIDDDAALREAICEYLEDSGLEAYAAGTATEAMEQFERVHPEIALVDYCLPDSSALDLLPKLKAVDPTVGVIVLTGHGSIDLAVRAVKEGAEQFVTKPVQLQVLVTLLRKEIENQRNRRKQLARKAEKARYERDPFLGSSAVIRQMAETVTKVVGADTPILLQGETGTGKGVLAGWLHKNGNRAEEAFVDLNCAGLSRELLETELFGHEKGSFTGATASKVGLFEVAHRGTVFLDEIGDLDLTVQPKLLKVLEEKRFRRLGDVRDRTVNIHLIAATHHNLAELVSQEKFRSDLFYRINTLTIRIPPLRERVADIPLLASRLLEQLESDLCRPQIELSPAAMRALQTYRWPGNIRELRNVLERAALLCSGNVIQPSDLDFQLTASPLAATSVSPDDTTLTELERRYIAAVLQQERGNVQRAADRLAIPRSTLYVKIKQYRLSSN